MFEGIGNVPVCNLGTNLRIDYMTSINSMLLFSVFDIHNVSIPYYIIDFNSNECMLSQGNIIRYNNYPHIVLKNLVLGSGEEIPEGFEEVINTIELLFNQAFTEITKEEYLEIHNQCIAGTWVPEWE